MANTYSEIREDLKFIADILDDNDFTYKVYNKGIQFNAEDKDGIIHSFYPTSGTIVLHRSNDRNDRKTHTLRENTLDDFMDLLSNPERVQQIFNI